MAELENNLESTEETVETVAEAGQPDAKAEKGDAKPVKQGSSDEEKIESGKGEVVKPEENPVDKSVASVKKAGDETKQVKDAVNKSAPAPEKSEKLKEDEDSDKDEVKMSKMESIKAIVNNMKDMTKEELQKTFGEMSEEEVDETLTKAEVARKIVEMLKAMNEEEVLKIAEKYEDEEEEDDDDDDDDEMEESVDNSELESSLVEIEVEDDLNAISEALELSEENAEKARTIFKAAVQSKVAEIKESLESQYSDELKTSVEKVKGDLAEAVDKYLTYCAEEWTKENELAIERGLRAEMTENFIEGMKTLFTEHYVEVPEDKYNVMDELANRLDEMEQKLDSEVSKNMEVSEELDSLKRANVVREACEDLTESQKEKMESLSNGVDFKDTADFSEKVAEIKEAYFGKVEGDNIAEEMTVEEGTGSFEDDSSSDEVLDPTIARYSSAISKLKPLG
jgi:hypothetical protein|tara:strand:- start:15624 stop:16982 length:1359 start_codon:yes stop_codon:yes gene_type:complete